MQVAYIRSIEKLIAYQHSLMELRQGGRRGIREIRNELIMLGAAAVLLGIAMAFWITLSLTRTLGGEPAYAAELLKRIADGDLSGEVAPARATAAACCSPSARWSASCAR
jgi:methyl-accepting chemotaxis protein